MLRKALYQAINKSILGSFFEERFKIVSKTDPNRIYVEQLRSFFGFNTSFTRLLCRMAVKEELFIQKIGIECPKCGRQIMSCDDELQIPHEITCETCELLEERKFRFTKNEFISIPFYQLNVSSK